MSTSYAQDPARPFLDDQLVEQRIKQRRALASIPDWLLGDAARVLPKKTPPGGPFPERLEAALRAEADKALAQITEVTEPGAATTTHADVHAFIEATDRHAVGHLLDDVWSASKEGRGHAQSETDPMEAELVNRAVLLLDLADRVAGDYRDPRLEDPSTE